MIYVSGLAHNYFEYYANTNKYNQELKERHILKLFAEIKNEFYNSVTCKWGIKECIIYCNDHQLEPLKLINFLELILNQCKQASTPPRALKSAISYLSVLKESKKFNSINPANTKIKLLNSNEILNFLTDMKTLKSKLDITHEEMVDFISMNFNLGLKKITIRRYYFDKENK